jgi:hypothetical protein
MAILREVHQTESEVLPITRTKGDQRHGCTLSLTRTLKEGLMVNCTQAVLLPRKEPRHPVSLEEGLNRCGEYRP